MQSVFYSLCVSVMMCSLMGMQMVDAQDLGFAWSRNHLSGHAHVKVYDLTYTNHTDQALDGLHISFHINTGDQVIGGSGAGVWYGDRGSNRHLVALDHIGAQTSLHYQFVIATTGVYQANTHQLTILQGTCDSKLLEPWYTFCNNHTRLTYRITQVMNHTGDHHIASGIYQSYFYDNVPLYTLAPLLSKPTSIDFIYGCSHPLQTGIVKPSSGSLTMDQTSCQTKTLGSLSLMSNTPEQALKLAYVGVYGSSYVIGGQSGSDYSYSGISLSLTGSNTKTGHISTMISGMYSSGAVSTMSQLWSLSDVALDHTIQDILAIRQQTEMKYFKLLRLQAQQSKKLKTIHRKHIHTKDGYATLTIKIPLSSLSLLLSDQ